VGQSLLDFSGYIKFFVGLFALVNPVGILPVFISMTSYQAAAGRNKTNLTANLSVAIILWTSLFWGKGFCACSASQSIPSALPVASWWLPLQCR
jgi:small neutral amino acid transporter SnatA (MarC family)